MKYNAEVPNGWVEVAAGGVVQGAATNGRCAGRNMAAISRTTTPFMRTTTVRSGRPVFGSGVIPVIPTPEPRPREWNELPTGRIGWSYESRDWTAEPNDGRPNKTGFIRKGEAISYLGESSGSNDLGVGV